MSIMITAPTMTRDQQLAHLAIHGWQPYVDSSLGWWCVWNAGTGYGFSYDEALQRVGKSLLDLPPQWAIPWENMPVRVFTLLTERIEAERSQAGAP